MTSSTSSRRVEPQLSDAKRSLQPPLSAQFHKGMCCMSAQNNAGLPVISTGSGYTFGLADLVS